MLALHGIHQVEISFSPVGVPQFPQSLLMDQRSLAVGWHLQITPHISK
jgi:hypothetical protein